jgi:hypothetical protein
MPPSGYVPTSSVTCTRIPLPPLPKSDAVHQVCFEKGGPRERGLKQQIIAQGRRTNDCILQVDLVLESRNQDPEKQRVVSAVNLYTLDISLRGLPALSYHVCLSQCHYFAMSVFQKAH